LGALIAERLAKRHGTDPGAAQAAARGIYRTDLYRDALSATVADLPGASEKVEGAVDVPTSVASPRGTVILEPDLFFDGMTFDPAQ